MRKDLIFIGLLLITSASYSFFKGYIDSGIGLIMTSSGGYILAIGLFFKYEKEETPPKMKGLPNRPPKY